MNTIKIASQTQKELQKPVINTLSKFALIIFSIFAVAMFSISFAQYDDPFAGFYDNPAAGYYDVYDDPNMGFYNDPFGGNMPQDQSMYMNQNYGNDVYMQQQYQDYLGMMLQEYRYYTNDYQTPNHEVAMWLDQQMMAAQMQQPVFNSMPGGMPMMDTGMGYNHQQNMQMMQNNFAQHNANWNSYQAQNDANHQSFIDYIRQ